MILVVNLLQGTKNARGEKHHFYIDLMDAKTNARWFTKARAA